MNKRCRTAAALCALAIGQAPLTSGSASTATSCEQHFYAPADGRLVPHLLGQVLRSGGPVVGFEIVRARPLVATAHQLLGFTEKGVNEMTVPQTVTGLSLMGASRVELQTSAGFQTVGQAAIALDQPMTELVHGRLYGSGSTVSMEVRARQGVLEFLARSENGAAFPIAAFRGQLRAASWNAFGLAAVVGESLYIWQPGAKNVIRLLTDRGLVSARDAVVVGDNRVVVALRNTVLLVTPETIIVVSALPLSRCRFDNGTLYVLEESNGLIWSFQGLEKLGTKQADRTYAQDLLKQAAGLPAKQSEAQTQEAARILGCEEVRKAVALTPQSKSSK
jgi:hypothetical protein